MILHRLFFYLISSFFTIAFARNAVTVNGDNTILIISSVGVTIDKTVYKIEKGELPKLKITGVPKKISLAAEVTETVEPERMYNEFLAFSDSAKDIGQVKAWLKNRNAGYKRLADLFEAFLKKNSGKIKISGNPVALMRLNEVLLNKLGRETKEPLKATEEVDEAIMMDAYLEAWYEKNSNSLR